MLSLYSQVLFFCLSPSFALVTASFSLLRKDRQLLAFMVTTSQSEKEEEVLLCQFQVVVGFEEGSYWLSVGHVFILGPITGTWELGYTSCGYLGPTMETRGMGCWPLIRTIMLCSLGYAESRAVSKQLGWESVIIRRGKGWCLCLLA